MQQISYNRTYYVAVDIILVGKTILFYLCMHKHYTYLKTFNSEQHQDNTHFVT